MRLDTVLRGRAIVRLLIVRVFPRVMGRRPYDRGLWCVVDIAPRGAWTLTSRRSDAEASAFESLQDAHHYVHDVERVLGVAPSISS